MEDELYVVSREILPDFIDKVIKIKEELESDSRLSISDLCRREGISRSTFYKYRDMVFRANKDTDSKAIISFRALNVAGVLSSVLTLFAECNANIITVNQDMAINDYAFITVTINISRLNIPLNDLISEIKNLKNIKKVELIAFGG